MTAHPIDTEALREHLRRLIDASAGPGNPTVSIGDLRALLDALAAAEHRATRAEAQSAIRGRAVVMYRERARKAEARIEAVRELHKCGEVMAWFEDCTDPEAHYCMDDPHGGGTLCTDEILGHYCHGCAPEDASDVTEYPWPCPTIRALDRTV